MARRDIHWLAFFALVLGAWTALYLMAGGIAPESRGVLAALAALCTGGSASTTDPAALWIMWALMGAAMMLPTLVPFLGTLTRMTRDAAGWWGVILGYGAIWAGFALLATLVQSALAGAGLLDSRMALTVVWLQGALLALAGLYQLSNAKMHCQSACLSPTTYLIGRYRPGLAGGVRMGVEQGLWCLGCCWAIMALAFVGGVMNLVWMGLATVFMVLEKLPQLGGPLRRPAGWGLVLGGIVVMAFETGKAGVTWL
ncbi:DUF2182 domain-containing protein [Tropicibacter sp. S64]|uniref:DUF2182 domain-containing protein n=1 Tax=Tropicibacter sp. S64 TaxID=3415122 RepID=UPI003C7E0E56